ncbi:MAG: tRNA pseudouridine(38-40) synthase TruA [Anaerolineae bacterium]|nr:tRNA pseudouridine(38-40) synthase TruA [Anaerolineae bacterium]MDQ7033444.1 tRNA pseudouridine(38-40) synthase TruA [Anaerolineae bacterium]
MIHYRATLAYDGTAYYGYQIQPNVPTIQGKLEQALLKILSVPTTVWAAGRTDTGVHATGQVIAFDAEWKHDDVALLRAINAKLPDDIALQTITQQANFHPRFDALSRTYRYQVAVVHVRQPLLARRAWQWHGDLDYLAIQHAAQIVSGKHDFAAFGKPPQGDNTVREIFRSAWHIEQLSVGKMFIYEVEATAYLHHMVRRLVGTQIAVGRGQLSVAEFEALLHSADLSQNKWIAPPQGLTLVQVSYPPPTSSRDTYRKI